jgi:SpoVK/Ycf46/Vps4 family AAA+-type ATPase
VAGELGARFFSLGLNDVLDMWLGESERHLHDAFQVARRAAPCVLFLDEIDAARRRPTRACSSWPRRTTRGTSTPRLRRPGRLDRTVLVLPPDEPARRAILEHALAERPVEKVDARRLARQTDGFSGADLVHLVETATEEALQRSASTGTLQPVSQADVDRARKDIRPSTRAWFEVAHNYALYANEGGQYDDLLTYIRQKKLL